MRFDKPPRTLVTQGGRCAAPFQFRHFDELLLDMGAKVDAWTTTWLTPPGPGAFAGFGDADENAAFHERMTPLAHEWCCRENGTVPHLPTPYGEEERYAYARE